ncbi:hypothetical protein CVT24_013074 [Panaeolus cyanescens]|uniref:NADH:flavin oxidoreductase/NADH oxidase N-terminal domain-containing protein n=1 Tax=Panaeolus cyanescens TaxID=181874 RepID=A0A409VVH5_9AGAR|nr:hypothetical protein CVT24_013074 [Panaeolus cyanescens]
MPPSIMSTPKLFQPVKMGRVTLQNRVVLCPLTRLKSTKKEHVPVNPLVKEYYSQRASGPGTLLITEATFISAEAGGYDYVPGIWSRDQINEWKKVTDAVHENGSHIYMQLWALGRAANAPTLKEEGLPFVAPSPIAITNSKDTPRALTIPEIQEYVQDYVQAAKNAMEAGFDGVELHFANGYLPDQFLQDVSNHRTDEYGGSIENRCRFPLEVVNAVAEAVGEDRTALRISPWSTFQSMGMKDPVPQFSHFVNALKISHPNLSYLHVVEPRVSGSVTHSPQPESHESNDFLRRIWAPKVLISAGGYTREKAIDRAEQSEGVELIGFGKLFIANPDLVRRLKEDTPLNPPIVSTFYTPSDSPKVEVGGHLESNNNLLITMSSSKLFQPLKVGRMTLQSRVVMSPMTRYKATKKEHVPVVSLVEKYYSQRGSHPGTLLITEGVLVSPKAGGYDYVPGIWSQDQIDAWKKVTTGVHEKGSYIYLQLWALGRSATPKTLEEDGFPFVAPSPLAFSDSTATPRGLTVSEIKEYVKDYAQAAKNSIEAGFDGVELHFANGYLVDQFLQDVTNHRTDQYGGSVENRSRFPLELVKAVTEAVGEERTGLRISPWSTYQGQSRDNMRMRNPIPQYTHFVTSVKELYPNFAYLHVVEPLPHDRPLPPDTPVQAGNDFLREIWLPKPFISAGAFTRETAIDRAEKSDESLISFGQLFISNPDLVNRLKNDSPLNPYDTSTFYVYSDLPKTEVGYIDYPFLNEEKLSQDSGMGWITKSKRITISYYLSQLTMSTPKLFQPIKVGRLTLQSRIVLCPLTRFKATKKEHVPVVPLVKKYYSQRGSHPGTLLITEGVFISPKAGGYDHVPGIWSQDQIDAWKQITDGVHEQGSYIYLQLWAIGRTANPATLEEDGLPFVAPSPIALSNSKSSIVPRELTVAEIKEYVADYVQGAKNAITAGFDGVELHFANGYLPDQFLQENSNQRTDEYGGSIENRSRFPLEIVKAVTDAVGEDRTGLRVSPWSTFQDMRMKDPVPQYTHFVSSLKKNHPNLSYLHAVEALERDLKANPPSNANGFLRDIWLPKPFISAGGYNRETAIERTEESDGNLVAFGKLFIANPDLIRRFKNQSPLNPFDSSTFYVPSDKPRTEVGYIDYPFLNEEKLAEPEVQAASSNL